MGFVLAGFLLLLWQTSWASLAWLALPPLALSALTLHRRSLDLWIFITSFGAALWMRLQPVRAPATWYLDYTYWENGEQIAYIRRSGGLAGLLDLMAGNLSLTPNHIFLTNIAIGSLAVACLSSGLAKVAHQFGTTWKIASISWALFLVLNPHLIRIAASDSTHNFVILALAVCFLCYTSATQKADSTFLLYGVIFAGSLSSLTRPEFLGVFIPICVFIELSVSAPGRSRRLKALIITSIVIAAVWPRMEVAGTLHAPSLERLVHVVNATLISFQQGYYNKFVFICAALLWPIAIFRHSWALILAALTPILMTLPRVVSDVPFVPLGHSLGIARYEIAIIMHLTLAAALTIAYFSVEVSRGLTHMTNRERLYHPVLFILLAVTSVLFSAARPAETASPDILAQTRLPELESALGRPPLRQPPSNLLSWQWEYVFLENNLDKLPKGARIVTAWSRGEQPRGDFDVGLGVPHTLLLYARPDIEWVLPTGHPPKRPYYLFHGSAIALSEAAMSIIQPSGLGELRRLKALHRTLATNPSIPVAQRTVPANSYNQRFEHATVQLSLTFHPKMPEVPPHGPKSSR